MKGLLLVGSIILAILMMPLMGCQQLPVTAATFSVPERANAIATVEVAEILNDEDVAELYAHWVTLMGDPSTPQTLEAALNQIENDTGVDPSYVEGVTLFTDLATLGDETPYFGALVSCGVPAKYLFELFKVFSRRDFPTQEHNGYRMYLVDASLSFAFLSKDLIVVGPPNVAENVIDTCRGYNSPVGGEIRDLYEGLGDAPVRLALSPPSELKSEILLTLKMSGLPVDLSPLGDMSVVTCALEKQGETVIAGAQLYCVDAHSAELVEVFIEEDVARSLYTCPVPEIRDIFGKVWVTRLDSMVVVGVDMTAAQVKGLMSAYARGWW